MRSTVNLAVLGLVIERPSYGYELSQRFGRRFGDLLAVGRSHIYAALDSLQRDGLIEPLPRPQDVDRPRQPRIHYRVTADGARTYREWVAEQLKENAERSQMLVRLAAVGAGQTDTIDLLLAGYERDHADGHRTANGGPSPGDIGEESAERLVTRLLDEERRLMREAQQTWIAFVRGELSAYEDDRR